MSSAVLSLLLTLRGLAKSRVALHLEVLALRHAEFLAQGEHADARTTLRRGAWARTLRYSSCSKNPSRGGFSSNRFSRNLFAAMRNRTVAPMIEQMLWFVAKGRPKESVTVDGSFSIRWMTNADRVSEAAGGLPASEESEP